MIRRTIVYAIRVVFGLFLAWAGGIIVGGVFKLSGFAPEAGFVLGAAAGFLFWMWQTTPSRLED